MSDESAEVRRAKVAELDAAGVPQREIARRLGVHHATVQRDLEAGVRPIRQRCEECAGPLDDPRAVTCSDECREARRKRHRKARWHSDPEWRAKRTRATAHSLVKRHGDAAPGWARALVDADAEWATSDLPLTVIEPEPAEQQPEHGPEPSEQPVTA